DELPPVPGLAEVWGGRVAHCPFCHAHEFAGGRIGILGTAPAAHLGALLAPVAGSVIVLPLEGDSADAPHGSHVARSHVVGMRDTGAALELTLADGSHESVDVAFVATALHSDPRFLSSSASSSTSPAACASTSCSARACRVSSRPA